MLLCLGFKYFITQGSTYIFLKLVKVPAAFHLRFKKKNPAFWSNSFSAIKSKIQNSFHCTNNESLMCKDKFLSNKNEVYFHYIIYPNT